MLDGLAFVSLKRERAPHHRSHLPLQLSGIFFCLLAFASSPKPGQIQGDMERLPRGILLQHFCLQSPIRMSGLHGLLCGE